MMYGWIVLITLALLSSNATPAGTCSLQATESLLRNKDPQVVKEVEKEWLQAYGERNTPALDCILADDFEIGSMPDEKGEIHDKKHVLDWVAQRSPTTQKIERLELEPNGDLEFVRGIYSMNGRNGEVLARYQFMDVFVFRGGRWQALARQIAQLKVE